MSFLTFIQVVVFCLKLQNVHNLTSIVRQMYVRKVIVIYDNKIKV